MSKPVCPAAIELIKSFEALALTCYRCPAGKPTIAWGSTKGLTEADVGRLSISRAEADSRLAEDVAYAASQIDRAVVVPLSDNQRGALVSLCFNTGPGAKGVKDGIITLKTGGPSTLLRRLNEGNYAAASQQFDRWVFAGGKKLNGLIRRRAAEKALFLTPDGQEAALTTAPIPAPVPPVSQVGSGVKVSMAGGPAVWLVASLWNAIFPDNPMPAEVAGAIGSVVGTGLYLLGDYLARQREPQL